jgi:uncharacterized protein (TIGR02217 family)
MLSFPLIESLTIQTTVDFEKNRINRDDKGREQRIIPHQAPLRKFNLIKKILTASDVNDLYDLFESMKGAGDSFLYQDKSDYRATRLANTFSAGVYTQGVIIKSGSTYLLCKKYACGDNIHYRPIYHADTLTIYSGDTVVTGWTFFDGGTITGLSGDGYTANFTFKTPVRFEVDKLENVISTSKNSSNHLLYSLNNVILSETRQGIPIILTDTFLDDCGHTFQIDFLFNATISKNYTTEIIPLSSGYEKRTSLQDDGITEIDFGDRTQLTQDQLEYLLCVWLNTKGCGAFFNFEDETNTSVGARFDNIPLSYTQRSPLPYPKYEVKGLRARLFYEGILEDTGYNGWTGSVLTLCDCIKIKIETPPAITVLTYTPGQSTSGYTLLLKAAHYGTYAQSDTVVGTWTDLTIVGNGPIIVSGFWTYVGGFSMLTYGGPIVNGINLGWHGGGIDEGEVYVYPRSNPGAPGFSTIGSISYQIVLSSNGKRDIIQLPYTNLISIESVKNISQTITYIESVDYEIVSLVSGQIRPLVGGAIEDNQQLIISYSIA